MYSVNAYRKCVSQSVKYISPLFRSTRPTRVAVAGRRLLHPARPRAAAVTRSRDHLVDERLPR